MRILYNAPEFGLLGLAKGTLTGVARVVEELAIGLEESGECELRVMASDFQGPMNDYVHDHHPGWRQVHARWQLAYSRQLLQLYSPSVMFQKQEAEARWRAVARFAIRGLMAAHRPWLQKVREEMLAEVDLFHSPGGQLPPQIAQRKNLPIFITIHDLIRLRHPEFHLNIQGDEVEQMKARLSPDYWYLCVSENTRADLLSLGVCDPAKVAVTPLAASARFRPNLDEDAAALMREQFGLGNTPYVLSVCTLEPRKNLEFIVRTFLKFVSERPRSTLKLVLVGGAGWNFQKLKELLRQNSHVADRVIVTGYVVDKLLPVLYSNAVAFVYLPFYEGFGLPPLEAMQCGAPVIVSNTSSLPEVVGEAGIQLNPYDGDGLSQALLDVTEKEELRASMSAASLMRATEFSWKRCAELTINAYRQAVG